MDEKIAMTSGQGQELESTVTIKRKEFEDGSSEELRIEQVDGGYIITKETRTKDSEGCWQWKTEKSVSTENPIKDESSAGIAERLESVLKGLM